MQAVLAQLVYEHPQPSFAKAGGTPPIPAATSTPGEIPAGPGLQLLRVSLPNRLEFNVELVVRTDPAHRR